MIVIAAASQYGSQWLQLRKVDWGAGVKGFEGWDYESAPQKLFPYGERPHHRNLDMGFGLKPKVPFPGKLEGRVLNFNPQYKDPINPYINPVNLSKSQPGHKLPEVSDLPMLPIQPATF